MKNGVYYMKNKTNTLYWIASIAFFIAAVLNFLNVSVVMGIVDIALGAVFLYTALKNGRDSKSNKK